MAVRDRCAHMKKCNAEHKKRRQEHYLEHKEHGAELCKEWQTKNREYVTEQIVFDKCGRTITRQNLSKHNKTQKCMNSKILRLTNCHK